MKVGLLDVDGRVMHGKKTSGSRFPNIALMKLSAWHKAHGDSVEWVFPFTRYDRVYASKIFTFSKDIDFVPQTDDLRKGGTGYFNPDGGPCLPTPVEHMMPDYALYGITDTAYGFMSRGCPRGCPFCIVGKKEGRTSRKVADLREFWDGQKFIELMDPNTLACTEWRDILGQLAESCAKVNFNQGVDIRLMTDEKLEAINKVRMSAIHFAWDGNDDLEPMFRRYGGDALRVSRYHRMVYVLVNYNTTMEWNLHRIYTLRELGYEPYVMVYDRDNAPHDIRNLARWVNNKAVFHKCRTFEEYSKSFRRNV